MNASTDIINFAQNKASTLSYLGIACLAFFLGRLKKDKKTLRKSLKTLQTLLDKKEKEEQEDETDWYYEMIARRTITLSEALISPDPKGSVNKYVRTLIKNAQQRMINREFHLQFYGDRAVNQGFAIYDGFDLYLTYQILSQRIQKWLDSFKSSGANTRLNTIADYPLLPLDIFTLCDLIQLRIDTPTAIKAKTEKVTDSFFYSQKYNIPTDTIAKSIISHMNMIVGQYITTYENDTNQQLFIDYLRLQKDKYDTIAPLIEQGPLDKDKNAFHPFSLMDELIHLEDTKRIGWCVTEDVSKIDEREFMEYKEQGATFETTLQHVYEMYLLALMYLPKKSKDEDYDKQTILNLIMLHDIGESHLGDSIPAYVNYHLDKANENLWCKKLYLHGVQEGISDLSDYWQLWNEWHFNEHANTNVRIVKELDKVQLLYKLLRLLMKMDSEGINWLTKERALKLWSLKQDIKTDEVKKVFNLVISDDARYAKIAAKYDLNIQPIN